MKRETANRIQLQLALERDRDKKPNDAVPEQGTECGTGVTSEEMENFPGAEALTDMNQGEQHGHSWCEPSPHHIGGFLGLVWDFCGL